MNISNSKNTSFRLVHLFFFSAPEWCLNSRKNFFPLHLQTTAAQRDKQKITILRFINIKHNRVENFQREIKQLGSVLISFQILLFQSKHSHDNCGRQSGRMLIWSGHRYCCFLHYHDRSETVNVTAPLWTQLETLVKIPKRTWRW